jgi:hypothetical protein
MKHCDNCGGGLGMIVRRKWNRRFCNRACRTAFEHRRRVEFWRRTREIVRMSGFLRYGTFHTTEYVGTASNRFKFALFALAALGTVSAGLALAQSPAQRQSEPRSPSQYQAIVYGGDRLAPDPDSDRDPHQSAVYSEPAAAPFNAYTYSASAQLVASGSKRTLQGQFRFPVFKSTPNVSVQIISSISAVPMWVRAVKISEIVGQSGAAETQIIVEAEPIFNVSAGGFYFANLLVTGVPVSPPTESHAQILP